MVGQVESLWDPMKRREKGKGRVVYMREKGRKRCVKLRRGVEHSG